MNLNDILKGGKTAIALLQVFLLEFIVYKNHPDSNGKGISGRRQRGTAKTLNGQRG